MQDQKDPFFIFLSRKLRNVLKRMKTQFSDICNFYFLRYGRFVSTTLNELGILTTAFSTHVNLIQKFSPMIIDNQLSRRIQSKTVRGLGVEPPGGDWTTNTI